MLTRRELTVSACNCWSTLEHSLLQDLLSSLLVALLLCANQESSGVAVNENRRWHAGSWPTPRALDSVQVWRQHMALSTSTSIRAIPSLIPMILQQPVTVPAAVFTRCRLLLQHHCFPQLHTIITKQGEVVTANNSLSSCKALSACCSVDFRAQSVHADLSSIACAPDVPPECLLTTNITIAGPFDTKVKPHMSFLWRPI